MVAIEDRSTTATRKRTCACWRRARPGRSTNTCRSRPRRRNRTASIARSPTGLCSTCSSSTCGAIAAPTATIGADTGAGHRVPRPRPDRMAAARAAGVEGDLEDHLRRHAAGLLVWRRHGARRVSRASPTTTRRGARAARWSSPNCCRFMKAAHSQHRLADGGRALHRRALLRSEQGGSSRISTRSGNSSPARSMPARSGPTIST